MQERSFGIRTTDAIIPSAILTCFKTVELEIPHAESRFMYNKVSNGVGVRIREGPNCL